MYRGICGLVAVAAVALSSGSASAAFADLELIRVYYDRNGTEIATDLGNVKSILENAAQPGSVNLTGSFGSLTANSSTFVVYFALDRTTGVNDLWATGEVGVDSVILGGSTGLTSLKSGSSSMYALYNASATDGGTQYTGAAAATSSYKNKLSATQGFLGNAINSASRLNTEASLAGVIGSGTGSVTQALYFWDNALTTVAAEKIGVLAATITTHADGSTSFVEIPEDFPPVPNAPIPPAFLLMGSGILGMSFLRRKVKVT